MNEQRERSKGGRRRRRKSKAKSQPQAPVEPVMIAARRPNSPVLGGGIKRPRVAASAKPREARESDGTPLKEDPVLRPAPTPRRSARIVPVNGAPLDSREQERQRLLQRVLDCDGRGAITRAARAYAEAGFEFPQEQEVQLQLLEHIDEECARSAMASLAVLIERAPLIKRPLVEQRLRRLEEHADEQPTRMAAAQLRRAIR